MTIIHQHNRDIKNELLQLLQTVSDPEIPVLSVIDLGIIRDVQSTILPDGSIQPIITITPTYSGCPAMDVISMNIRLVLLEA
ncbi:MAG: metal-sulfur cluster assembly factor, partial [Sediminibacterium sp.]